jgi:hypothetical protein
MQLFQEVTGTHHHYFTAAQQPADQLNEFLDAVWG